MEKGRERDGERKREKNRIFKKIERREEEEGEGE